jgi:hypothetical protein
MAPSCAVRRRAGQKSIAMPPREIKLIFINYLRRPDNGPGRLRLICSATLV